MPRTCTPTERATIAADEVTHHLYLDIADADGVLRDTSALGTLTLDMLDGATWGEDLEQAVVTPTFTLRRDTTSDTLAPLMGASSINRNGLGAYAPFLEKGRAFRLRAATVPPGVVPLESDKKEMLLGRLNTVKSDADPVTLQAADLAAWLQDAWIQDAKTYASTTLTPGAGLLLDAVIQAMLNDTVNAPIQGGAVSLYVPVTPAWQPVGPSPQQPGSLFQAIRDLAQEIGWECRYRYDASDVYRLTLYEPDRANTTADWVIGPSEYTNVTNLQTDIKNIRNIIRVKYVDANGMQQSVTVQDDASKLKYGPRFMQIVSSTIRTETDALSLANAVLSDTSEADADQEITMPFFWPVQLGDLITFQANGVHYDADQTLAVVGYTHTFRNGDGITTLRVRGKVAGAYRRWLRRGVQVDIPAASDPSRSILRIAEQESSDGLTATETVRVGALVDHVQIFSRTVAIDAAGDPYDFSDPSVPATVFIERPVAGTNQFSCELPQPQRGFKLAGRMVPYYLSPAGEYLAGDSVPFTITAAPPAINVAIHATKSGHLASLSIDVKAGVSDLPASLAIVESVLGVDTTILTLPITGPVTIDSGDHAELANRVIPAGAESVQWRGIFTDAAGDAWPFGPVVALPPLVPAQVTVSESVGVGTVTASITDSGNYLDAAGADLLDATKVGAITWHVTRLGVTDAFESTTLPGSGTAGVYTLDVELDPKHPIIVSAFRHYVDGSTDSLGSWTFDTNKIADAISASAASNGANATVTVLWDTDALDGVGNAQYSLNAGATWTAADVSSELLTQVTIARTSSKQTMLLQAKNAADGAWGNTVTVEVDAYLSSAPSITAKYIRLTDSTGQIVWSCTQGIATLSIDAGTPSTPPASPIAITLDGEVHSYNFEAASGGLTDNKDVQVPALPSSGGAGYVFATFDHALQDAATDTIRVSSTGSGSATAFDLETTDPGYTGDPSGATWASVGTVTFPYDYVASENLSPNPLGTDSPVDIGFRATALNGVSVVGSTVAVTHTYQVDL